MARGRRGSRGPSLLIPMIVVIFAWLGLTYFAYDLSEQNIQLREQWARARELVLRHEVAHNANGVEQEKLSAQIGFRGPARESNYFTIGRLVSQLQQERYDYFTVNVEMPVGNTDEVLPGNDTGDALTPMDRDDVAAEVSENRPFSVEGDLQHLGNHLPQGFDIQSAQIYQGAGDLEAVVAAQDEFINRLLEANRRLQLAIIRNAELTHIEHAAELSATRTAMGERDDSLRESQGDMNDAINDANGLEVEFFERQRELNDFYTDIWQDADIYETVQSVASARLEMEAARRDHEESLRDAAAMANEMDSVVTSRSHHDGTIYFVDLTNRRAYINLGRKDAIRPEMNFEVVRYVNAETPMPIGTVSVHKVLGDRTAACRISNTLNADVQMQPGDRIIQRDYFAHPHPERYALVGNWGHPYTAWSREETERMLREAGFTVDPEITRFTQVIVLGAGFREDPYYRALMESDLVNGSGLASYTFWRPAELYNFLGRDPR